MAERGVGAALKSALRWVVWSIEAVPFFVIMGLFKVIGLDAASWLGSWLARWLAPLSPAHQTARRNLERAFPEKSAAEIAVIRNAMWENLGRTFAEYPHLGRFGHLPNSRLEVVGAHHANDAQARGGVILISAHLANWEVICIGSYLVVRDGSTVVRPVNNPIVNWWIGRQRTTYGYPRLISKRGDPAREILRTLKAGKPIAMLVDQKHREGEMVPFFGRDAPTVTGTGVLSIRTGAPVIPIKLERLRGARFRLTVEPEIKVARTGDKATDVRALLVAINAWLEGVVRAKPELWLWAHDRWQDRG